MTNAFPTSGPPACGTDIKVAGYTPRNYAISSGAVGSASHTVTIPAFIPNTLQQYLVIWATNGNLSADGFYISDISIVAQALSFNISPASLSTITCGSAISQTFTAVNNTNFPGVTGYTWNLGPTPNNWYYQGSPAPPTVNLPGNTITLTVPGCSPIPTTPLSVRANLSGGAFVSALNTVGVSMNPIQLVGPASMCGQPTVYYISNLSCPTANVNWSANPSGDVSFSCTTCTQTTLTKLVNGSNITLTANLSGACSASPYNLSQPVSVDAPNNLTGTYSTSTNTYPLQTVNFVRGGTINGQYNWGSVTNQTLTHSGSASWSYGGNGTFGFYITTGQNMNLNFSGISATCGTVTASRTFLQSSFGNLVVTASPVPSNGMLSVSIDQVPDTSITFEKAQTLSSTTFKKETKVSILDVNTGNLIKQWTYQENESTNYNLNINGYKAGIYILKVERNNRTVNTKIILQ